MFNPVLTKVEQVWRQAENKMNSVSEITIAPLYTDWSKIPVEKIGEGIERQMIVGEKIMICRLRFAPHTITAEHDHPHEQMTLVERGKVLFTIGDTKQIAKTGDVLHFPSNVWHGATMLEEEVVLIDIFSPIREDFL